MQLVMKYTTNILIALTVLITTATVCADAPDAGPIVSMQAEEFALPDAIEMVRIPAGKFTMGSPQGEIGRGDDEPQRTITISKPFYMAKSEIKQSQYVPMMRPNYKPVFFGKGVWGTSLPELHQHGPQRVERLHIQTRRPTEKAMDGVSWKYAVEFCKKLSAREGAAGRLPKGYEYRLPTEAEWEYACRAGTTGAFNDKQVEKTVDQVGKTQGELISGEISRSEGILNAGGVANSFGLEDMHMGVLEWVLDDYAPYTGRDASDSTSTSRGRRAHRRPTRSARDGSPRSSAADLTHSTKIPARRAECIPKQTSGGAMCARPHVVTSCPEFPIRLWGCGLSLRR